MSTFLCLRFSFETVLLFLKQLLLIKKTEIYFSDFLIFWFLVVKDSVSGVKAGVAAGMPVVGLGTRNPEKSLLRVHHICNLRNIHSGSIRG